MTLQSTELGNRVTKTNVFDRLSYGPPVLNKLEVIREKENAFD